jgi:hypothetical protein
VEGRDLSSRRTQHVVKDMEIGQPINSESVQKLQMALHAKMRASVTAWGLVREPDAGDLPVRLCVQRRLVCSAGVRPAGATVRSPVVRIAGWRETKILKPIDEVSLGEITSHRAVTTVNVDVASKMNGPEGRACNCRVKAAWGAEI